MATPMVGVPLITLILITLWGASTTLAADRYQTPLLDHHLKNLVSDTKRLVRIPSYRTADGVAAEPGLRNIQTYLLKEAERFNAQQKTVRLQPFNWEANVKDRDRWVFGFRVGEGPRKITFITHLDTVPPGDTKWRPFKPRTEQLLLNGTATEFLVGRGALDDKGPSALAFAVMKALAQRFDGSDDLKAITFELVFDTAEETGGSIWAYFEAVGAPDVGLVLDSVWCTVAEKGIERPTFTMPLREKEKGSIWLASLDTSPGPVNQIPETARAVIKGRSKDTLDAFADVVGLVYESYRFDDPSYRAASLRVSREGDNVILTTFVVGAQHGSTPEFNRAKGANPLVSLAVFLSFLSDTTTQKPPVATLATNSLALMTRFMASTWGTHVFGELQPKTLVAHDTTFQKGNGTTYALTRFTTGDKEATLKVDVRYASDHHDRFASIFRTIIGNFNRTHSEANVSFTTRTAVGPDFKNPKSPAFRSILATYKDVTGGACPLHAIGGGTDAKGEPNLFAVGPTFGNPGDDLMGPPRNFHGQNEGVPLHDLTLSGQIYYRWAIDQVVR